MKKRLDLRIESELRDGLDLRVEQSGAQLTSIVERYIRDGLAKDAGTLIELNSLPEVRVAVRDETTKAMGQLYQQLSADLEKAARRDTERLAKISSDAARAGGIGWRMVYALISHLVEGRKIQSTQAIYEDAKAKAGKALRYGDEQ